METSRLELIKADQESIPRKTTLQWCSFVSSEEQEEEETEYQRGGVLKRRDEIPWDFGRLPRPQSTRFRLAARLRYAYLMLEDCVEFDMRRRGSVPVLKGTRFTAAQVLAQFAEGDSISTLVDELDLDEDTLKRFLEGLSILLDRPAEDEASPV